MKIFCRPATGVVIGGVVVAANASELILPIAIAVQNLLSVNDLAQTLSVYPSLSGSVTEAARQLIAHDDLTDLRRFAPQRRASLTGALPGR